MGDRDWERSRQNQIAATVCASGQLRFAELFLIKNYKTNSNIGFETSLIVVEAIRGWCASFMILTATVSEICGGQTNSSILVVYVVQQCWGLLLTICHDRIMQYSKRVLTIYFSRMNSIIIQNVQTFPSFM